ncbi:HIT family protein [Patescibacteria group bacterium]
MKDCIFCKIVAGEIPCQKVYEDDDYLAFLDIRPLSEGQSLVIPKKHAQSNLPDTDTEILAGGIKVANKVAKMIQGALDSERVFLAIEGIDVAHFHYKLFPSHGKSLREISESGHKEPSQEELEKLAEKIRNS